jgi:prepilin-type N-terminal cleavage/methylation domain-containing protein
MSINGILLNMLKNWEKTTKGFTLIELLFVIAIIGVLASFGVSMAVKRTENLKIKKTALEIQQLLQAAMSYNVDHKGDWPDSEQKHTCTNKLKHSDPFYAYIPAVNPIKNNPWGYGPYCWKVPPNKTGVFYVYTDTPTKEIAQRIAALLPDSQVIKRAGTEAFRVKVGITVPAQSLSGLVLLASVGHISMALNNCWYCDGFLC